MTSYTDDDLLMLSGIQHIAFCERQWAFIHIEQQWNENVLTVEGHHLHQKVDDPFANESRCNTVILRAVSLVSYELGLYGRADVVELVKADNEETGNTIEIKGKTGRWKVIPVEYKRGKPKPDERDEVKLCAQAMCLEEMHSINISKGYLYYGETHHRHEVEFSEYLRSLVKEYSQRMHKLFSERITPSPVYKTHCKSCSLYDTCLPKSLCDTKSVNEYLKDLIQ